MIYEITSLKDEKIQFAKSLNSSKKSNKNKKFLIEGEEALNWAIKSDIVIDYIFINKKEKNLINKYAGFDVYILSEGLLKKITETNYLINIVAIGNVKENISYKNFTVVLDNLVDYGNIGTIIRTCNAFGINDIIATKKENDFYKRKTVDSSRGKVYSTNFLTFDDAEETINWLKQNNYQIITTSPYGNNIQSMVKLNDKPVALILGNETVGVNEKFIFNSDLTVQIPMYGSVESLNVGVAAGISIYELKLKQILGIIVQKIKATLG
ncbi:MAG TPA: RNA methyltransferase, partial [Melioribacteraceae bacterium]|nr:RNA methyltransferase [Melioribacteraceae bacterium]